jgi:hypothetical protein
MPYKRASGASEPRPGGGRGLRGRDKQQDGRRVQRPARAKAARRRKRGA